MAMSGYFTEGQPSPGVHSPPTWPDYDQESLSKEPIELSAGKNYDTIKGSGDGKYILIFCCAMNSIGTLNI